MLERLASLIFILYLCAGTAAADGEMDADSLMAGVDQAVAAGELKELHSLLVFSRGELRYERYFPGNDDHIDFEGGVLRVPAGPVRWDAGRLHYVASVTKTVTALLAGIALKELNLDVTTKVADLLPPDALRDDALGLTLEHLLTMRTGFKWDEWTSDDLVRLWQSDDFARFLMGRENLGPGTVWQYNSAGPNLLLLLLERKLGRSFAGWADERFFAPLGIRDYIWHTQPDGTPEASARLFLTPRAMLHIGQSILDEGRLGGRQIVPEGWVTQMTRAHSNMDNGAYGYLVWLREPEGRKAIVAEGDGGQYIWVFPEDDLIVVITQGNYLEWPLYRDQAERLLTDFIFPAFASP